jgi:hypothetical protein
MPSIHIGPDVFESHCDLIDVTSLHRPDPSWRFVDADGHQHVWFKDGRPATSYHPAGTYDVPTIEFVFEEWGYFEDGERYAIGHQECRQCRARVPEPGFTAEAYTQYLPGLRHYTINGEPVSKDEFEARAKQAGLL